MMLPVVVTLILFVTSFETNGNDGILKGKQNRQWWWLPWWMFGNSEKKMDLHFMKFFGAFRGNLSIIFGNMRALKKYYVSVFSSSFML